MSTPKDNETHGTPSQPESNSASDDRSELPDKIPDFPINNDPNAGGSGTSTGD